MAGIENEIEIQEGVTFKKEGTMLTATGPKGNASYNFTNPHINIDLKNNKIKISTDLDRKKQNSIISTLSTIIKNMMTGVKDEFTYEMKVVYSHFPITTNLKDDIFEIKNLFGEKGNRYAKIVGNTKIVVKKEDIVLTGTDKYAVGQTAANIEQGCKIRNKDRRVFKDGIYITKKA
ncbi:MAG: 50S ribosomal protein L6 [DPANN group archaeon]|nr:50S ribosomal protein L6 [DPANN group archaeon]